MSSLFYGFLLIFVSLFIDSMIIMFIGLIMIFHDMMNYVFKNDAKNTEEVSNG